MYLQEVDIDIGVEDDTATFSEDISGSKSILWYYVMKDEMDSMLIIKSGILLNCLKEQRPLATNGSLKLKKTPRAMLKDIKQDL